MPDAEMGEGRLTMRTLAVLMLLAGCADLSALGPPLDVYLVDVPEADRAAWETAVSAWNSVVGSQVLTLMDEPPGGSCGVYVYAKADAEHPGTLWPGHCVHRVEFDLGWSCVAAHELGHALGLPDEHGTARSVMHESGCTFMRPSVVNGYAVRAKWGLQ